MSDNKSSGGIGFTRLLLLAFIILKLTRTIDWSWWWVLSPAWIVAGIALIVLTILFFIGRRESEREKRTNPVKSKWQERLEEIQQRQREKRGL